MKATVKFLIASGFIALFSVQAHAQGKSTAAMDSSSAAMMEMCKNMMGNKEMMGRMMDDPEMMKMMMNAMMNKAENDSSTCRMMGNMMMNNDHMKSMINDKMNNEKEMKEEDHMEMHKNQN
ncbi:hypothetical protein I2I11_02690 [Pontibacter sp. 172403-2]|uniref:hypothetical protein n=1 Tax=Pontibacter rufus TaxID=2791028 RepID=UPI0018AFB775|nr:hypothetical protein [Pontibacter sp. 172403-2]MBF9252191.1 hypothetical protein [Pontibacter sp. 172403-2]